MPDLGPLLGGLAFSYGAACAGLAAALGIRLWTARAGRVPTIGEATWCVFLPALAVCVSPLFTLAEPQGFGLWEAGHQFWHRWERAAHATPFLHGGLHVGNALLLGIAALTVARTIFQSARMWSYERALRQSARQHGQLSPSADFYRLPSDRPLCFTVGLFRPAIYVTDRLLEALSARDQAVMLGHEQAHLRRRDPLLRPLLVLFYSFFLLPGASLLLRDWSRAAERACDAEAGRRVGSRAEVAGALVRVARLVQGYELSEPLLSSFAGELEDIQGRVGALLQPDQAASGLPPLTTRLLLAGLSLGLLFPVSFWLRHAVEFFVRH